MFFKWEDTLNVGCLKEYDKRGITLFCFKISIVGWMDVLYKYGKEKT